MEAASGSGGNLVDVGQRGRGKRKRDGKSSSSNTTMGLSLKEVYDQLEKQVTILSSLYNVSFQLQEESSCFFVNTFEISQLQLKAWC